MHSRFDQLPSGARKCVTCFQAIYARIEIPKIIAREPVAANKRFDPAAALELPEQLFAADVGSGFVRRKTSLEVRVSHW